MVLCSKGSRSTGIGHFRISPRLSCSCLLLRSVWSGPLDVGLKLLPAFVAADFLVDFSYGGDYKHRCSRLEACGGDYGAEDCCNRNPLFFIAAHILANIYVIVLECGRLWGHVVIRNNPFFLCQRFDWHCGRLAKALGNFRQREAYQFGLFLSIVVALSCSKNL